MNFREHEKGGNLFLAIEHQQKMTKHTVGALKLKTIIDWNVFLPTLIEVTGYDKKENVQKDLRKTLQREHKKIMMLVGLRTITRPLHNATI